MVWKKILLEGDAVALSDVNPVAIGTTASPGTASLGSRDDHVHIIGTGAISASTMFSAGVVDANAIASNAVGASELDETATDITFKQIILTPSTSGSGTSAGTIYYDSDDFHPYVYQT